MPVAGRASIGRCRQQVTVLYDVAGELDLNVAVSHSMAGIFIGIICAISDIMRHQLTLE